MKHKWSRKLRDLTANEDIPDPAFGHVDGYTNKVLFPKGSKINLTIDWTILVSDCATSVVHKQSISSEGPECPVCFQHPNSPGIGRFASPALLAPHLYEVWKQT